MHFFLHPERMQYDIRHLRIHISIMIFISKFHFDVTPSTLFVDRAQKTIDGLDLKWPSPYATFGFGENPCYTKGGGQNFSKNYLLVKTEAPSFQKEV